jgi:hypothetical protein
MNANNLSYTIYSEFKDSDWYIYWDREFSRLKDYQLLVVWFVSEDNHTYYDYITLKKLLSSNTSQNGLQYVHKLSEKHIKDFVSICEEFCKDVDKEFSN